MAQASFLSPPPVQVQHTDSSGHLTPAWQRWYQQAYLRLGGQTAISNASVSANSQQLASAYAQITQGVIYTSPTGLATVIDGFSLGNIGSAFHSINVWIVPLNGSPINSGQTNSNQFVTSLSIAPGAFVIQVSTLISQTVPPGGSIVISSDVSNAINVSISGRQTS